MPLHNEAYWRARLGRAAPCWSGERWLDWEHAWVVRSALRRLWPAEVRGRSRRVLDVGCGDGRWTAWMARRFGVQVRGVDALEYPGVRDRLGEAFRLADAERLTEEPWAAGWRPDLVVCLNTLTSTSDWRRALGEAAAIGPRVLVFDNFQTPTPPWLQGLPHRQPITVPELTAAAGEAGLGVERAVAADVMHRRLFLRSPRWAHPAVALVSAGIDLVAARLLRPGRARHSAWLFRRRAGGSWQGGAWPGC